MIVLLGDERPLADALSSLLRERSCSCDVVTASREAGSLIGAALAAKPRHMVAVESLQRLGADVTEQPACLNILLRAASVAGVRRLVLVTSRDADDPELLRLRRSGIPYVIVRARDVLDPPEQESLAGHKVLIPRPVAEQASGAITADDVCAAVATAVDAPDVVGTTADVQPASTEGPVVALLASRGADPRIVTPTRAQFSRWLGRATASISSSGRLNVQRARGWASRYRNKENEYEGATTARPAPGQAC